MRMRQSSVLWFVLMAAPSLMTGCARGQGGKLKISVTPKQAYVFVDGNAIREGSQTINLSPGKHTVTVENYGYKSSTQDANIELGKTTTLNVTLEAFGGPVSGPFGKIKFKGDKHAAVLLNGKAPDYFVAHVGTKQLLTPPGTYQATVTRNGKDLYSGPVTVAANQETTADVGKGGAQKTSAWSGGAKLTGPQPRYSNGTVVVAAAGVGSFAANPAKINCGESASLSWATSDTAGVSISEIGDVEASGQKQVSPRQTTTYTLKAIGPGGTPTQTATLEVNTAVSSTLDVNPAEVKFRKVGDKVVQQDSSTLTWTTTNADKVSIDPLGDVSPSGNQAVKPTPPQTAEGPVNDTATYTLKASNACGGSDTKTATLHISGSIEPTPNIALSSVFYPTSWPDPKHAQAGLLRSQQESLKQVADNFKKYQEYDSGAKLAIAGYADKRGSKKYNLELSRRRAERAKEFLVQQGVGADRIETSYSGNEVNLDPKEVKTLEGSNPSKPAKKLNAHNTWLAYNRRVDFVLGPSGKKSDQHYPHRAPDASVLEQFHKPAWKTIEKSQ